MNETSRPTRDYEVWTKTRDVVAHHNDAAKEGRPLHLLVGGGVLAAVCAVLVGLLAYRTWYAHEVATDWGYAGVGLLFAIYTFGVFLFSYGYELYDTGKALRLTLIIAVLSVVALFMMIAVLALAAKLKDVPSVLSSAPAESDGLGSLFGVAGSMVSDEAASEPDPGFGKPWNETPEADVPGPFLIHCIGCGGEFTPQPPRGVCPDCGRAALSAS